MSGQRVKKPISQKELLEGTEFEIDPGAVNLSSDEEFDDDFGNAFSDELRKLVIADQGKDIDLATLSLAEVKSKMTPLLDDKMVLKLTVDGGTGTTIPSRAIVFLHYSLGLEDREEPFDSSYLRGKPKRLLMSDTGLIPGMDIALKTMHKGELSKVWIHHSLAYKEVGCPPRIPPCADLLCTMEVINFIDCKETIEFEEMTPEDQQNASFPKVFTVALTEHKTGNEMFQSKKYPAAISRYQRAKKLLEDVSVANEEEDKKRLNYLQKLYLNLSFCYLKLKKPIPTIVYCKKVLNMEDRNVKALFRLGEAQILNNEFDLAKKSLLQAKSCKPYDEEINASLLKLEEKRKKYNAWDKNFCHKMFQSSAKPKEEVKPFVGQDFIQTITDRLNQFQDSSETEYILSSAYGQDQLEAISNIAQSKGLLFSEKIYNKQKIIKVLKNRS